MNILRVSSLRVSTAGSRTRRRLAALHVAGACLLGVNIAWAHVSFTNTDAGSTFLAGSSIELSWEDTIPHQTQAYHLEFHPGEGREVVIIAADIPPTEHSYVWAVPGEPCMECSLVVIQDNAAADYSSTREISIVLTADELPPAEDTDDTGAEPTGDDEGSVDDSSAAVDPPETDDASVDDTTPGDATDVDPNGADGDENPMSPGVTPIEPSVDDLPPEGATSDDAMDFADDSSGVGHDDSESSRIAAPTENTAPVSSPATMGSSTVTETPSLAAPDTMPSGELGDPTSAQADSTDSDGFGCSLVAGHSRKPLEPSTLVGLLMALALCWRKPRR